MGELSKAEQEVKKFYAPRPDWSAEQLRWNPHWLLFDEYVRKARDYAQVVICRDQSARDTIEFVHAMAVHSRPDIRVVNITAFGSEEKEEAYNDHAASGAAKFSDLVDADPSTYPLTHWTKENSVDFLFFSPSEGNYDLDTDILVWKTRVKSGGILAGGGLGASDSAEIGPVLARWFGKEGQDWVRSKPILNVPQDGFHWLKGF